MPRLQRILHDTSPADWVWLLMHWRYRYLRPGPVSITWPDGTVDGPLPVEYLGVRKGHWSWGVRLAPQSVARFEEEFFGHPAGFSVKLGTVPPRTSITVGEARRPFRVAMSQRERKWFPLQVAAAVWMVGWFFYRMFIAESSPSAGERWFLVVTFVVWLMIATSLFQSYRQRWPIRTPAEKPIIFATRISDDPAERVTTQLDPVYGGFWDHPGEPPEHFWTVDVKLARADYDVRCEAIERRHACLIEWADGACDRFSVSDTSTDENGRPEVEHISRRKRVNHSRRESD